MRGDNSLAVNDRKPAAWPREDVHGRVEFSAVKRRRYGEVGDFGGKGGWEVVGRSPADGAPVGAEGAGIAPADSDGGEFAVGGCQPLARCSGSSATPAFYQARVGYAAAVIPTRGDLGEFSGRRGCLESIIAALAEGAAVFTQRANVFKAYRQLSEGSGGDFSQPLIHSRASHIALRRQPAGRASSDLNMGKGGVQRQRFSAVWE